MSAFMMSEIDFVVLYKGLTEIAGIKDFVAFKLVKEWELDNAKSIEYRYSHHGEKAEDMVSLQNLSLNEFKDNYAEEFKTEVDINKLVKTLHCLRYQSCEHWVCNDVSKYSCSLNTMINRLDPLVNQNSEEYRDAPWGNA